MHESYRRRFVVLLVAVSRPRASSLAAQPAAGSVERIRVPGPSLEGNLPGDDATRDVFVYLPPSYSRDTRRRYPVVVFLHGYTATADAYVRDLDLPQAAIARSRPALARRSSCCPTRSPPTAAACTRAP